MSNVIPAAEEVSNSIKIIFGKKSRVEVIRDIFIKLHGCWYIIPKGFVSDGASLPWALTLLIDRMAAKIILFSILHDYFYRTQFSPRFYADAIYESGLEETANTPLSRSFYVGLRMAGGVAWRKNKKKGLEKYPEAYQRLIAHICIKESPQ